MRMTILKGTSCYIIVTFLVVTGQELCITRWSKQSTLCVCTCFLSLSSRSLCANVKIQSIYNSRRVEQPMGGNLLVFQLLLTRFHRINSAKAIYACVRDGVWYGRERLNWTFTKRKREGNHSVDLVRWSIWPNYENYIVSYVCGCIPRFYQKNENYLRSLRPFIASSYIILSSKYEHK